MRCCEILIFGRVEERGPFGAATLSQPLLVAWPFITATVNSSYYLGADYSNDVLVHLKAENKPVVVSRQVGRGWVFVVSGLTPFTNEGLRDPGNAALVYNLILAGAGRDGMVALDEYHHGEHDPLSLRTWLVSTPPGWAILYGCWSCLHT